jgi:phytoene dehydrogenase-like protein
MSTKRANTHRRKKALVIGAGIAGLCTGIYLRKMGYDAEIVEMHSIAGGLCTSWSRSGYTFDTCIHWFTGARQGSGLYKLWQEVFDVGQLRFYKQPMLARIEDADGNFATMWSDVDQLEHELLTKAPEDAQEIRAFAGSIKKLSRWEIPSPSDPPLALLLKVVRSLPYLLTLRPWMKITTREYANRFTNPFLRRAISASVDGDIAMLGTVITLAWLNNGDGAYPMGGSRAVIGAIQKRYECLGGRIHFNAKVKKIIVEHGQAVGVQLQNGETIRANVVVSAADGHAALYEMLDGQYLDDRAERPYKKFKAFPSYLQVSLGVQREFPNEAGNLTLLQPTGLMVDPQTWLHDLSVRVFNFDRSMAPPGKTALTCFLPTHNYAYWKTLCEENPATYQEEKNRVAKEVIDRLERRFPRLRDAIEVIDVATPATVHRFTNNWRGSMEGWLISPGQPFASFRNTLPKLKDFYMVGHWMQPGGGLPSGVMTARKAVRAICKNDGIKFAPTD